VELPSISNQILNFAGITLTAPPQANYAIAADAAIATALREFRGGTVVDTRLVGYANAQRNPPLQAVCWAVSLTGVSPPFTGPRGVPEPAPGKYTVVFVDAATGAVIDGISQ
jgi:hypothetical protein